MANPSVDAVTIATLPDNLEVFMVLVVVRYLVRIAKIANEMDNKEPVNVYAPLPNVVLDRAEDLGLKPSVSKLYVETFLTNYEVQKRPVMHKRLMMTSYPRGKEKTKRRRNVLTSKEKKKFRLFDWKKKNLKYGGFAPLNDMWTQYFQNITRPHLGKKMGADQKLQLYTKLLKADYHGCEMTVVKSKCPTYIGVHGILIQETRNVFRIVCEDDTVKIIPKMNSIFEVSVEGFKFRIHGSQFRVKSGERSVKKFKAKPTLNLK